MFVCMLAFTSSCHVQVIPSALLIIMYAYRTSMHSYIRIVASHLGTLGTWEARGVEPNPKIVLVDPLEDGKAGHVLGSEMSTRRCKLTDLTLCRIPGKPRSILSLLLYKSNWVYICYICIVALSYRSWLKTLAAYISFPCPVNMSGILFWFRIENIA
jgi:hypothetical protein